MSDDTPEIWISELLPPFRTNVLVDQKSSTPDSLVMVMMLDSLSSYNKFSDDYWLYKPLSSSSSSSYSSSSSSSSSTRVIGLPNLTAGYNTALKFLMFRGSRNFCRTSSRKTVRPRVLATAEVSSIEHKALRTFLLSIPNDIFGASMFRDLPPE